ncbi:MAG: monofunctional biosynthetic peptidoglycan transglycosylase [Saprospiraceae bacterium]|nr:monofunctional biosynthetic peptidoglycan transglycosylase [Saprospiraceae bacterium]MBK7811254.1 monofunctional biosynthetic peptidoglycan transglycosylase [Saprospiraceae bacterium]
MLRSLIQKFLGHYKNWKLWQKGLFYTCCIIGLHWIYMILLIWLLPPITTTQIGSLLAGKGLRRDYVSISKISKMAPLAVMAAEDQLFLEHSGFDFESIEKAMEYNKKSKKKKRGASTISQQVAKNVFLWQGRSWFRKGLEVYFTFMIEMLWSKKRIMNVYLNTIEMGEGVFGIEAASKAYFKKPAIKLTREEAARIGASLPNPKRYKVSPPSSWVMLRTPWVLRQMEQIEPDEEVQKLMGYFDVRMTSNNKRK